MFNEKAYICRTIKETINVLKDITDDYEIIIIDDASTDGSGEIAEELAHRHSSIKVAHHKRNRGLGGSLKTGFGLASKQFTLYSDMDLPFDLKEIRKALDNIFADKADLVCSYRLNAHSEGLRRYMKI